MSTSATPSTDDDLDAQIVPGYDGGRRSKSPLHGRTFTSWEELASQPLPEREWVIDKLIPCGLVSIIVGESGIGKSMLVLDMMHSIAQGKDWAGQYACPVRKVALLDLEGDFVALHQRMNQLNGASGVLTEAARRMLFLSDQGAIDICDRTTQSDLIQLIQKHAIAVLFIDTLICTHVVDENGSEMKSVMDAFDRIARTSKATIVLLHHTGKPRQGRSPSARGHSSIKGAVQHELTLHKDRSNRVKISLTKAKSGPTIPFVASIELKPAAGDGLTLHYTHGKDGKATKGRPSDESGRQDAVIAMLRDLPRSFTDIVKALCSRNGCSERSAKATISNMLNAGKIRVEHNLYLVNQEGE